jgi:hypothetical protein
VALNSLLQELAEVHYTGYISITWKKETISLVIQKGKYLLAEFGSRKGDTAWEAMNALGETIIDAILADFSDPELKLAVEFNEACLLPPQAGPRALKPPREKPAAPYPRPGPGTRPPAVPVTPPALLTAPPVLPPVPPPVREKSPAAVPATGEPPVSPKAWTEVDMGQAIAVAPGQGEAEASPPGEYDELALLHMEISALDDVDVEHIATKIRKNARGIVKKLHLGHLMTEKEE